MLALTLRERPEYKHWYHSYRCLEIPNVGKSSKWTLHLYWTMRNQKIRSCIASLSAHETTSLKLLIGPGFCFQLLAFPILCRYSCQVTTFEKGPIQSHGIEGFCPVSISRFSDMADSTTRFSRWQLSYDKKKDPLMAFRSQVPLSLLDTVWNIHLDNLILLFLRAQLCGRTVALE